jgi:hypothetical protein
MGGAGRIALGDGNDVGTRGQPDGGIGDKRLLEDLADQRRRHLCRADETGEVVAQGSFEPALAQDGGVQGAGQHRLGGGGRLGGIADPCPDRIDRPGFRCVLDHCAIHGALLRPDQDP